MIHSRLPSRGGHRQIDTKGRALHRFTLYLDKTFVAAYDSINHGKTQTRSLTGLFRREKRLEDSLLNVFIHSYAGVDDLNTHVLLWVCFIVVLQGLSGDNIGLERELAAFRHRVACIDAKIQQRLHDLIGVGRDWRELMVQVQRHLDGLWKGFPEQRHQRLEKSIGIYRFKLSFRFPGQGQELLYDGGCPFDHLIDDINIFGDLFVFDGVLPQNKSISLDDVENIIKVVGDSAGKGPDTFHF